MENKITISIGRQYGSGGSEIGRELATKLGFAYYDKEIITIAAQKNGLCSDVFEQNDERPSNPFVPTLPNKFGTFSINPLGDYLSTERLFELQSTTIHQLATEKSCVIIGRCADYILRGNANLISFFISDSLGNRIKRISEKLNITESEALTQIKKIDKSRASYYNFFTDKKWGSALSYNLCVDVSILGIDKSIDLLMNFALDFAQKNNK